MWARANTKYRRAVEFDFTEFDFILTEEFNTVS